MSVIILSGCFMPRGEDPSSRETGDDGGGKDVSSVISSFFEPSSSEKAQTEKIRDRQKLLERQNQQLQKERAQSYQFPDMPISSN